MGDGSRNQLRPGAHRGNRLRTVRQQGKRPDRAPAGAGHPDRFARTRRTTGGSRRGRVGRRGWRSGGCRSHRPRGSHRPGWFDQPAGTARDQGPARPGIRGNLQLDDQLRPQRCRRFWRLKLHLYNGLQPRQHSGLHYERVDPARRGGRLRTCGSSRHPGNRWGGRHSGTHRYARRPRTGRQEWRARSPRPCLPGCLSIREQLHAWRRRSVARVELGLARDRQPRQHTRPKPELLGHPDSAGAARPDRGHRSARSAGHRGSARTGRTTRRARRPGPARHCRSGRRAGHPRHNRRYRPQRSDGSTGGRRTGRIVVPGRLPVRRKLRPGRRSAIQRHRLRLADRRQSRQHSRPKPGCLGLICSCRHTRSGRGYRRAGSPGSHRTARRPRRARTYRSRRTARPAGARGRQLQGKL